MTKLLGRRAAILGALWLLLGTSSGCYLSRSPAEGERAAPDGFPTSRHADSAAGAAGGGESASGPLRRPPATEVEPQDAANDARPGGAAMDAGPRDAASTRATTPDECSSITEADRIDDDGDAGPRPRAMLSIELDGPPAGTGEPESARVVAAIKAVARSLLECYALAPEQRAALGGSISVRFTVEHDGRITGIEVTRDTLCGGVGTCVTEILQGLALTSGSGAGSVTYSYMFTFTAAD